MRPFDLPSTVVHALDFFIWAALDEAVSPPTEPRPFGGDERHYNAVLNEHFGIDMPSTAKKTRPMPVIGDRQPRQNVPTYFPDAEPELNVMGAVAKDLRILNHFQYRQERLEKAASLGSDARAVGATMPTSWVLVNAEAYAGYFRLNREQGLRFAEASHDHREAVALAAPRAAVIPPNTDDPARMLSSDGWKAIFLELAEGLIADALDPEALLLWGTQASITASTRTPSCRAPASRARSRPARRATSARPHIQDRAPCFRACPSRGSLAPASRARGAPNLNH